MKFAHFSDVHIGGWREEQLKVMSIQAFLKAVDICISENVAFVLISGDLFNTALPPIDQIRDVAAGLAKLKENDIEVYLIPGSHDYSPSGKTMIEVLEKAGLCHNVFKLNGNKLEFTVDKTGAKITGILGLACGLDKKIYEKLDRTNLEEEKGFKIFLFHATLEEFKPASLEMAPGEPTNSLPKNFNYYAGGHPHYIFAKQKEGYGLITYPGALFPNNFKELEEFKHGGFYIVDDKLNYKHVPVKIKDVETFNFDANNKNPKELEEEIKDKLNKHDLKDKIVTIRIEGTLKSGKPGDVNLKEITSNLKDSYFVLRNAAKLESREMEELKVDEGTVEEIESKLIKEIKSELNVNNIITILNKEKDEGERNIEFENRVMKDFLKMLDLDEVWK